MSAWVAQVSPGHDPADVIGRRLQNWVYAWQGFTSVQPGPSAATTELLLESIDAQVRHLRANLTAGAQPPDAGAVRAARRRARPARARPRRRAAPVRLGPARRQPAQRRVAGRRAPGVLDPLSPDRAALVPRRPGERPPLRPLACPPATTSGCGSRAASPCTCTVPTARCLPCRTPTAATTATCCCSPTGCSTSPSCAGSAHRGRPACRRSSAAVGFPVAGYYVQRSGWGDGETSFADERFLVLDAGPIGDGGHGHYDMLAIEAYAHGRPLLVDPGRYTYSEAGPPAEPNWRHWFKGTPAHSTVTVDGLDQTPYRRGKPRKQTAAAATLLTRNATDGPGPHPRAGAQHVLRGGAHPRGAVRRGRVLGRGRRRAGRPAARLRAAHAARRRRLAADPADPAGRRRRRPGTRGGADLSRW